MFGRAGCTRYTKGRTPKEVFVCSCLEGGGFFLFCRSFTPAKLAKCPAGSLPSRRNGDPSWDFGRTRVYKPAKVVLAALVDQHRVTRLLGFLKWPLALCGERGSAFCCSRLGLELSLRVLHPRFQRTSRLDAARSIGRRPALSH